MAMGIPQVGLSRFMKEGSRTFKGTEEAVQRNIDACIELAGQIRTTFGPNGMNKMVINHLEKLFVTNDAAMILKELDIEHPAAKMLVLASIQQEKEVGDGTNTVIILSASLLEHASKLIYNEGLSTTEIADGFDRAAEKALEILPTLVVYKADDLKNVEKVINYLRSSIMSKQYGNEDFIAELVAQACVQILPKNAFNFNVENIRVCKILGAGLLDSRVVNGMVFNKETEGEVKQVKEAKIAVFTCPFDLTQTETKGTVLINSASELLSFSKGEESVVEEQIKALHAIGVNVVVSGGKFGDLYLHFLNKFGIMAVRLRSKFDLRRLCRTIRAQALTRIDTPTSDILGHCSRVFTEEIGDTNFVVFEQDIESVPIATLIIRGSSDSLLDDIERAVDDAVNTFKALCKDNRMLAGGGAVEVELARQIQSFGEKCSGLDQYAIENFAQALQALPKQLAINAGVKPLVVLSKLYATHEQGQVHAGFDIDQGGVKDAVVAGIFDLYSAKYWAIKLATDAAVTVLKIDQIIMSKRAQGGPSARGPKTQDEDED